MASTSAFTLTASTWTQVGNGSPNFGLQFANLGKLKLHIAEVAPGPNAPGFIMTSEEISAFSASGLKGTDGVWAKAIGNDVAVTVIEY